MAPQPEIDQIRDILEWIEFANAGNCTSIIDNDFSTYAYIQP